MSKRLKRNSSTRPEKITRLEDLMETENAAPASPVPSGDADTPTKRGTLARIKDFVLSPLKNLSPTKTYDFGDLRKVTWSPGVAVESPSKRGSSRRRKPGYSPKKATAISGPFEGGAIFFPPQETSTAPLPAPLKLDLIGAASPSKGKSSPRRETLAPMSPRNKSPNRRESFGGLGSPPSASSRSTSSLQRQMSVNESKTGISSPGVTGVSLAGSTSPMKSIKLASVPHASSAPVVLSVPAGKDSDLSAKRANSKKREAPSTPPTSQISPQYTALAPSTTAFYNRSEAK